MNVTPYAANPFLSQIRQYQPARKYVIFLGWGDHQFKTLKEKTDILVQHGIPAKDIIIHDSPFLKYTNIKLFIDIYEYLKIANPFSGFSKGEYEKLKRELTNNKVMPGDELVFIGYSAGGQEAVTLASLLAHDPLIGNKLVKRIITLGTGFMSSFAPKGTELDIIDSDQDNVLKTFSWHDKNPFFRSRPLNFDNYPVRKLIHFRTGSHFSYTHAPQFNKGLSLAEGNWSGEITVN